MAVYNNMIITNAGQVLWAKVQTGAALTFTRMQIGSYKQQAGDDPATFTACRTPIAFFPISNYSRTGSTAQIRGIFQNTSLTSNTYTCEIGLYAQDPDIGEIMYAYANAGANGDTFPPFASGPFSRQFKISLALGNATTVTAQVPAETYVENDGGVIALLADAMANRPKAGTAGRIFISTDTQEIYRDTGSAWQRLASGTLAWTDITNKPATLLTSITAGQNIAVTNPSGYGAATVGITGVIPVANGGTGSSTQNFVDLSTAQLVGGMKTFTATRLKLIPNSGVQEARFHVFNGGATAEWLFGQKSGTSHDFILSKMVSGAESDYFRVATNGAIYTANNTMDDGSGTAKLKGALQLDNGTADGPEIFWNDPTHSTSIRADLYNERLRFWSSYRNGAIKYPLIIDLSDGKLGDTYFKGTVGLPHGWGDGGFYNGTGDGASYSTYNFRLKGWYGLAMSDYSGAVNGYYDFRAGKWVTRNGFAVGNETTTVIDLKGSDGTVHATKFLANQGAGTGGGYSFDGDGAYDTGMFSDGDGKLYLYTNGTRVLDMNAGSAIFNVPVTFNGGGFASSLAQNGYQKLPSGLILQWGTVSIPNGGTNTNVNFPIAFPNSCFSAVATDSANAVYITYMSVNGITVYVGSASTVVTWMAVGC
ncbi:tail fiber protein [Paenibacillus sp. P25]|nr:tail fiber protein [Paenibacillus sp. P25]